MPSQKVIDYVQDAIKKGFSKKEIAAKLKDAGYSDKNIEEACGNASLTTNPQKKPKITLFLIVGLVVIFVLFVVILRMSMKTQSQDDFIPFYMVNIIDCEGLNLSETPALDECLIAHKKQVATATDCEEYGGIGSEKEICLILVENDISLCDNLPASEFCKMLFFLRNHDAASCKKLKAELLTKNCEHRIYDKEYWGMIGVTRFVFP